MNKFIILITLLFTTLYCVNAQNTSNNNVVNDEVTDPVIRKLYSAMGPYSKYDQSKELIEKRTENSKTFDNNDGSYTALMAAGPMHYFEDGVWKTSSNEIIAGDGIYKYKNIHNAIKTMYANIGSGVNINNSNGTVFTCQNRITALKLYDASKNEIKEIYSYNSITNPVLVDVNTVNYPISDKLSYLVEQRTYKLKSSYEIQDNIFSEYNINDYIGFEEVYTFDQAVTIVENSEKEKSIDINNTSGTTLLRISELFYFPKSRLSSSQREEATYKLTKKDANSIVVTILIPLSWLQNPETSYPVVIDPTITCTPNTTSATFWTGTTNEDADAHSSDNIKVGFYDCSGCDDETWAPYAKINTSTIPDNACISNSSFQMYQHVWRNGNGNDGLRFDIGWANVEPVSASWASIRDAVQGLAERYATWDVWGTPGACGGCNGGWDFNEACCGWENFNIDYALHRTRNKERLCSDYITIGLDMTANASDCYWCWNDETNELEFRGWSDANRPQLAITYTNTTAGNPATFGTNQWNAYAYACGNIDLTGSTYAGFYTETSLGYNSTSKWCSSCSPSAATGYTGACVGIDNHIVVSKRQGFPCAVYQINIPSHDDDARVYINGTNVWQHLGGCCDAHTNIWTGYLGSTSTIEYRHQEGGGGSNQEISFTNVTTSLSGGTIAGIASPTTICVSGDPGAFTSTADASGGTIGISNGSPAAPVYQWERAPTNTFTTITNVGTNSTTYDPDASLTAGTYYFRRKVTDACGTVAYSNVIQVNVVADPTAPTLNVATPSSGSSICLGGTVSATINAGSNGTGTCTDEYRYSDDGGSSWTAYTPGNSITAVSTGTNRIQVQTRRDCSGTGCDGSGETFATIAQWSVVTDPTTPGFTPTPIDVNVCVGTTLTIVGGGSTGGAGTCIYEYAIDPGTGTYGAFGASNSVVASGTGIYKIKVRRNCNGTGCDISGESENSWNVVAQPIAGTLNTATPAAGAICQGQNVSATINAGSGGVSGVEVYEYSTDGGSSWSAYTSGATITTATATTSVQIRVSRTSSTAGCNTSGPNVIVTWPVTPQPTLPTLNVATPTSGTEICQGDVVNATITAGTGGTGASDVYEYSIDNGGTWNAYTSGANIVTTTASGAVKIRVSRTAGSGTGCNATSVTEIVNWPIRTSGAHVVLATSSTNGQVLPVECVYSNWTYYADPSDDDDWLIAINWDPTNVGGGHNNTARTNALVYLDVNASNIFDEKLRGSGYTDASYVSRRYWNVDLQGNTLDGPVQLRYFYALSDTSALRTQRDAKLGTLAPFHQPVSFSWFKTVGIPFTPSLINDGNNFTFSFVTLTPIGSGTENGVNYVDFTVSSFSGGSGGLGISPYPNTPLPVTYTSISAVPGNEAILVNWTTATEINNKGFEVQRSTDARNFTTIGFVNGHNNSSTAQQYVYTDTKVDVNTEYYYRLNQIDNDGKSELSNIVSAILLNTEGSVQVGNPYPNPTTQSSNIQLLSPTNGEAHISIVNSMGQVVSDKTVQINKGSNMLTVSTENIAAGIYNIHINIGGQRYYRSLSVTK